MKLIGRNLKKNKWQTLCASEWPTFQVGWPPEGTFSLDKIKAIKSKVFHAGYHGHPDQIPYALVWEDIVTSPPLWVKPFLSLLAGSNLPAPGPAPAILTLNQTPEGNPLPPQGNKETSPKKIYLDLQSDLLLMDPLNLPDILNALPPPLIPQPVFPPPHILQVPATRVPPQGPGARGLRSSTQQ